MKRISGTWQDVTVSVLESGSEVSVCTEHLAALNKEPQLLEE